MYYVIGGFDGPVQKCATLQEAKTLAKEIGDAVCELQRSHGLREIDCKLPIEILTEKEWREARRCD